MNERQGWAVETRGLTRERGGRRVVEAVTMTVAPQQMVGLLGPSGAGKTALMEMLAGGCKPTAGQVQLLGREGGAKVPPMQVGYAPQQVAFSFLGARQTVRDYLLRRMRKRTSRAKRAARLVEMLAGFGLADQEEAPVGQLSLGQQRRLVLAGAVMNQPALLLLDDPCGGLDARAALQTADLLTHYRQQGGTILLASNRVTAVEPVCDALLLMREGKIVQTLSPSEMSEAVVELEVEGMTDGAMDALRALASKLKMQGMPPTRLTAYLSSSTRIPDLARAVVENGTRLHSLIPREETLEERYLRFLEP